MSKTLFLMVGAFTICLLPITVVVFCEVFYLQNLNPMQKYLSFDAKKSFQFQVAGLLAHIFLLSNSSMNGMIYSWMSWRFRGEAKIFIFKVMKKKHWYCPFMKKFHFEISKTINCNLILLILDRFLPEESFTRTLVCGLFEDHRP